MSLPAIGLFMLRATGTLVLAAAGWAVLAYLATAPLGAIYGWSGHPPLPNAPTAVYVVLYLVVLPAICLVLAWRMIRWMDAASRGARDAAAVRVFPPAIPLLTVLAGVGLDRLWPIDAGFELAAPGRYWIGGAIALGAVLGLGLWSVVLMRRSGQSENPWKPTTRIIEAGPFRITRNPMYLQMVLVCIGFAVALMNAWILVLTPLCAWLLQRLAILPEESYLEAKFGETYLAYKRKVRRWI
jgi:protein-S-isoprenylcysteine O-methyltransferase Ste14